MQGSSSHLVAVIMITLHSTIPTSYTLTNSTLLSPSVNSYKEHEQNNVLAEKVKVSSYKNNDLKWNKLSTSSVGVKNYKPLYMAVGTVNMSYSVTT